MPRKIKSKMSRLGPQAQMIVRIEMRLGAKNKVAALERGIEKLKAKAFDRAHKVEGVDSQD